MIVVVKGGEALRKLREMCDEGARDGTQRVPHSYGVHHDCYVPGVCKRIYTTSVRGVSGEFTNKELDIIKKCLAGEIKHIEADAKVQKAEEGFLEATKPVALPITESPPDYNSSFWDKVENPCEKNRCGKGLKDEFQAVPIVHEFGEPYSSTSDDVPYDHQVEAMAEDDLAQIVNSEGTKSQRVHVALWNLDRIDQRDLPLDRVFHYGSDGVVGTGENVTVYILDSGIRPSHSEFLEWDDTDSRAKYGYDFIEEDPIPEDCDGHGTHVASTAVGRSVGIAKQAVVRSVRVLDCQGSGNISTTVAGLDWVANNYETPGVVALSLGVSIGWWSETLEQAVKSLVNDHGLTVVVASGNSGVDSCFIAPANVPETITVAASNLKTKFGETAAGDIEGIYKWSNTGSCVDVFAPGVDIYAACGGIGRCSEVTDRAYTWASGTSMAVPHVAGVAATYLGQYPDATPEEVKNAIVSQATMGRIQDELMKPGTPNRLLYSNLFGENQSDDEVLSTGFMTG